MSQRSKYEKDQRVFFTYGICSGTGVVFSVFKVQIPIIGYTYVYFIDDVEWIKKPKDSIDCLLVLEMYVSNIKGHNKNPGDLNVGDRVQNEFSEIGKIVAPFSETDDSYDWWVEIPFMSTKGVPRIHKEPYKSSEIKKIT